MSSKLFIWIKFQNLWIGNNTRIENADL
jgi:hypothetical protein